MPLISTINNCCKNAFRAVRLNHIECLMKMNQNDLEESDNYGQRPLHIACKLGNLQCVDYIIRKAPNTADLVSHYGENPLLVAIAMGKEKCVQRLLQGNYKKALTRALHRDLNGTSSLMAAVARNDNDLAFWLLKRFGKTLAICPNNYKMLPLHLAASRGNIEFIRIVTKYDNRMTNEKDIFGLTPVFYATQGGHLECLQYLVEKCRADISLVTQKGQSLLQIACLGGHLNIVQWLLRRSSPTAVLWTTKDNVNSLHCAAYQGNVEILKLLLNNFPKRNRREALHIRDFYGNTPLHLSALKNNIEAVQYLLNNGAHPKLINAEGQTAENIAQIVGNFQISRLLQKWIVPKDKKMKKFESNKNNSYTNMITDYSSGYSSIGSNLAAQSTTTVKGTSERYCSSLDNYSNSENEMKVHRLGYIATDEGGRLYFDSECQTDHDPLTTSVKMISEWKENLDAVEQIDRVLREIDHR